MSIDEILDEMDELLDKATSVPFVSHKKILDGERMRELINDVRLNMPHELKEAKKIEFDCQRILNEAKLNAEAIIRKAGSLLEPAFALWWCLQAFCLRLNRNVGFDCLLDYSS